LCVGLAVVKPWADREPATAETSFVPAERAAVDAELPLSLDAATDEGAAARLLAATAPHDAWGIRALVDAGGSGDAAALREHWESVEPAEGTYVPLTVVDDGVVRALGVTAPLDETPLDIRAWAELPGQGWRWLDARRPASPAPGADLLLLPPPTDDPASAGAWPEGRYRLDLLLGERVVRADVTVGRPVYPSGPETPAVPGADIGWADDPSVGPFVVADGVARPLADRPSRSMDARAAWLDVAAAVASASAERVTTLGVVMPPEAADTTGILRQLAPDRGPGGPAPVAVARVDPSAGVPSHLRFDLPVERPFDPGTYALHVAWTTDHGEFEATWHVELRPGPAVAPRPLLAAARRFATFAGREALLWADIADRSTGVWTIEVQPISDGAGCPSLAGSGPVGVLGIGHAVGGPPDAVELVRLDASDTETAEPVRLAKEVVVGLTLVAPADAASFEPGTYRLSFRGGGLDGRSGRLCLGDPAATAP
jgi:hypothetical protein